MTPQEETNINWLAMAITLPTGYIGEFCYYDRQSDNFFILTNLDYILIDDRLRPCFINSYTQEEDTFLVDKLKRLEHEGQEIIAVPRISIEERTALQMGFVTKLDGTKYFKYLIDEISEQGSTTTFVLDKIFRDNTELATLIDHWWNYKFEHLLKPIDDVSTNLCIDLTTARLFHIEPSRRSMTKIKSPEPLEAEDFKPIVKQRAWWKIW